MKAITTGEPTTPKGAERSKGKAPALRLTPIKVVTGRRDQERENQHLRRDKHLRHHLGQERVPLLQELLILLVLLPLHNQRQRRVDQERSQDNVHTLHLEGGCQKVIHVHTSMKWRVDVQNQPFLTTWQNWKLEQN